MVPFENDYPRPQLKRLSWQCLNGVWDACVLGWNGEVVKEGSIVVPYSPEAGLSGFDHVLMPDETLIYRRSVVFDGEFDPSRESLFLHFGACDYLCRVFVDGAMVLEHRGGYIPFEVEVNRAAFSFELEVHDPSDSAQQQRGKQKLRHGGIWYTPQSGLWQTVWLEKVPKAHITGIDFVPDLSGVVVTVNASVDGDVVFGTDGHEFVLKAGVARRIDIASPHLWSPEDPHLYQCWARMGDDFVESYFGLRTFGVGFDVNGVKRLLLNGKPYFHHGLLDQGYYQGGLYTPRDEEQMVSDLLLIKSMGFNCLRKHIKIEPLRWYYHCDRLGIIVWQDMVNGGGRYSLPVTVAPLFIGSFLRDCHYGLLSRSDRAMRDEFELNVAETVGLLRNVTSIAMWVTFNEGWGQFDSVRISNLISSMDPSRCVDMHSGWHDQGCGDFRSIHVYFRPYRFKPDRKGRCVVLSEFGGYGLEVKGHTFRDRVFEYKGYGSSSELTDAVVNLYRRDIIPAVSKGLAAAIYTQVSDVEEELNGLVTYDREVVKFDVERIKALSEELLQCFFDSQFS